MVSLSYGELLKDFAMWCTVVCLLRIATTTNWLRVMWAIIFVIMTAFFIGISVSLILKFFTYPTSTDLTIRVEGQKFPQVTICNENPYKLSSIRNDSDFDEVVKLVDQYIAIEQGLDTDDDFGLKDAPSTINRLHRAQIMLRLLVNEIDDESRYAAGYTFTDLVSECTFAGATCSSADFVTFLHPDFGVCYTFVSGRTITQPGFAQGLRILATIDINAPTTGMFDFLPTTESNSIWAVAHPADEAPDFTRRGFRVSASQDAYVSLATYETVRLGHPYGECNDGTGSTNESVYTISQCYASCLQSLADSICGCVDPLYSKLDNQTFCTTATDMACLTNLLLTVSDPYTAAGQSLCYCAPACNDSAYHTTITNSLFPATKYMVATGTEAQRSALLQDIGGGRPGDGSDSGDNYNAQEATIVAELSSQAATKGTTTEGTSTESTEGTTTSEGESSTSASTTEAINTTSGSNTTVVSTTSEEATSSSANITTTASTTTTPDTTTTAVGPCPQAEPTNMTQAESQCYSQYPQIYNNPDFVYIMGPPCTSSKTCHTCVMFSPAVTNSSLWPCSYQYDKVCTYKTNTGVSGLNCTEFFANFDFLIFNTDVPSIQGYSTGGTPEEECAEQGDGCWNTVCSTTPAIMDWTTMLDQSGVIDSGFIQYSVLSADPATTTCDLVADAASYNQPATSAAPTAAPSPSSDPTTVRVTTTTQTTTTTTTGHHWTGTSSTARTTQGGGGLGGGLFGGLFGGFGKRRKRDADNTNSSTTAATASDDSADVPGYGSCEYANTNFDGASQCIEWYTQNGLIIQVYFGTLTITTYTESASYPLTSLLSDIAGHAGLWLGLSVVSLVEIVGLIGLSVFYFCGGKKTIQRKNAYKNGLKTEYDDDDDL